MKEKFDITASIVLYKENLEELTNTIQCFLNTPLHKKLFLIDNNENKQFENVFDQEDIEYITIGNTPHIISAKNNDYLHVIIPWDL